MTDLTFDELMAEIRRAESAQQTIPDDAHTAAEWAEIWGKGLNYTQQLLRRAVDAGVMEQITAYGYRRDGARCLRPVYRHIDNARPLIARADSTDTP